MTEIYRYAIKKDSTRVEITEIQKGDIFSVFEPSGELVKFENEDVLICLEGWNGEYISAKPYMEAI